MLYFKQEGNFFFWMSNNINQKKIYKWEASKTDPQLTTATRLKSQIPPAGETKEL
jgi:hypothetical protein